MRFVFSDYVSGSTAWQWRVKIPVKILVNPFGRHTWRNTVGTFLFSLYFSIIMLIFVCENNLSWRTKPLIDIRTRSWETVQSSILRCMRIGRMTGTSPELFGSMHVTASVSVRYKRLQD